jgi:aminodeoxyfutalosine synthase
MAGATTPQQQSCASLEKAIREAGREPAQRDTWYRHIESTWQKPTGAVSGLAVA